MTNRKTIIILCLAIATIVAVTIYYTFDASRAFILGEPDVMQEVKSPDGKYTAFVFESNGGATTKFTYRLSVLKNGKQPKKGDVGNAYISYDEFSVEWIDNNTLRVNNTSSANIFKQAAKISGIEIEYAFAR